MTRSMPVVPTILKNACTSIITQKPARIIQKYDGRYPWSIAKSSELWPKPAQEKRN